MNLSCDLQKEPRYQSEFEGQHHNLRRGLRMVFLITTWFSMKSTQTISRINAMPLIGMAYFSMVIHGKPNHQPSQNHHKWVVASCSFWGNFENEVSGKFPIILGDINFPNDRFMMVYGIGLATLNLLYILGPLGPPGAPGGFGLKSRRSAQVWTDQKHSERMMRSAQSARFWTNGLGVYLSRLKHTILRDGKWELWNLEHW